MKGQKGITLVALVITIIILLILAGISLTALRNTGLYERAQEASDATNKATKNEANTLTEYEEAVNQYLPSNN